MTRLYKSLVLVFLVTLGCEQQSGSSSSEAPEVSKQPTPLGSPTPTPTAPPKPTPTPTASATPRPSPTPTVSPKPTPTPTPTLTPRPTPTPTPTITPKPSPTPTPTPTPTGSYSINLTCTHSYGGEWNFGVAPKVCNVSPSIPQSMAMWQFSPLIFDHSASVTTTRNSYMTEMFALLRDIGTHYMKRRNPNVPAAELSAFLEGLYAVAHQETFWTHYRKPTDGMIRYMRGDSLHGHGMMQVDDRSHLAALQQGKGVDLGYNIVYGLDVFYSAWMKAATASCVGGATNYINRTRAAWSGYNGGNSRICRFATSPTTGDGRFFTRLKEKLWLKYVASTSAPTSFDVRCLVEGARPCALLAKSPLP